jgi:DNA-binding NarL/FixJ family response regulator
MDKIKVVLAIRHTLICQSLRALLENSEDFSVRCEISNPDVIAETLSDIRPRILLIESSMLAFDGILRVRRLSKRYPGTRIVVISLYGNCGISVDWLRNGAAAYIPCCENAETLFHALQTVAGDEEWQHSNPRVEELEAGNFMPCQLSLSQKLTPREHEILLLAAEGHTNAAIAHRLSISSRTVEGHRARGMRRMGLRTQTDLIRYAFQHGLIHTY